ncbi:MAG TPA: SIS domain-containing protein [Deltaproteobacteria bacterium]|nr:SIS domain-containing protein [Deltaproteobacteria bacterium]
MQERIHSIIEESLELHGTLHRLTPEIVAAAQVLLESLRRGNKIMFVGNGGSAADAQHIAAELVNRFRLEREPLAGLALTTDSSVLTSISNDYSFDAIYEKQIRALGKQGDSLVGISTSGNSPNIIRAFEAAREMGISTIAMTGNKGDLAELADVVLAVPSVITARIQEMHILLGHILCEVLEQGMVGLI